MSKYNKTHACAKVLHSLLCPLSSSSAFFQGLPRLHFAHFTHSSAEYIYQWQKKVNLERRSQVDRVWSCRADPPDPTFPISPLCSQTHCNWGQWKGEPSLPVPGHIWGDYFNNITNSDYLIPCGFWSTLSDRQAAKIPTSAQQLWFYLSRQVHYSPHERCP